MSLASGASAVWEKKKKQERVILQWRKSTERTRQTPHTSLARKNMTTLSFRNRRFKKEIKKNNLMAN